MRKHVIVFFILFLGMIGVGGTIPAQKVTVNPEVIFFENFEGSVFPEWTATGFWHLEDNDTSSYPLTAAEGIPSPSHYMWFGDNTTGMYDDEENGYLTSPVIDLSLHTGIIEFTFASYKQMWGGDFITVKYTNDGTTWHTIWSGVANNIVFGGTGGGPVAEIKSHSSTFQLCFCFDKDWTDGTPTAGLFGWRIDDVKLTERPSFDIWLPEDYYTEPGGALEFFMTIIANFSRSHDAQVVVNITTPSGVNETIHDSLKTFDAIGVRWDFRTNPYTCKERGEYILTVTIRDELSISHTATATCYAGNHIRIITYPKSGFYAFPGDLIEYSCTLSNYYETPISVDLVVKVSVDYNPNTTIFTETDIIVNPVLPDEPTGVTINVEHLSSKIGRNLFYFEVTDQFGKLFVRMDSIDVGSYFNVSHKLVNTVQYYALIVEEFSYDLYIVPRLFEDIEVNLSIMLKTPSNNIEILYEESKLAFSDSGPLSEAWIKSFSHESLEPGWYEIEITVVNASNPKYFWSHVFGWQAEEAEPTLSVTQTTKYPELGDKEQINFSIQSHYASDMTVDIKIVMTTPDGDENILHEETSKNIPTAGDWNMTIEYSFDEYGKYEVEFVVANKTDGKEWTEDSWWRVEEEETSTTISGSSLSETGTSSLTPGFETIVELFTLVLVIFRLRNQRRKK